jgi:hypothetical protein
MRISVEISMYPLSEQYIDPILGFIEDLNSCKKNTTIIKTNGMSTQIFGDYDDVQSLLSLTMKNAMTRNPKVVFATKFLNTDVSEYSNHE